MLLFYTSKLPNFYLTGYYTVHFQCLILIKSAKKELSLPPKKENKKPRFKHRGHITLVFYFC